MVNVVTDTRRFADQDTSLISTKLGTSVLEPNLNIKILRLSYFEFSFSVESFFNFQHSISVYNTTMTLNFSLQARCEINSNLKICSENVISI